MVGVTKSLLARCLCMFALCLVVTPAALAEPGSVDGLVLWLRADDVDGDGNIDESPSGMRVAQWTDLSGRGNCIGSA